MPVIAITGGIGSGKSLVLSLFEQAGCQVISMDVISRQLSEPGNMAYTPIVEAFGKKILNPDQTINRQALAKIIFNDANKRIVLEKLLHPKIVRTVQQIITATRQNPDNSNIILIEIPLLQDRRQFEFIDRILVVESSPELQLARTMARDSSRSAEDIENIISTQMSDLARRNLADDILYNLDDTEKLAQQVHKLYEEYQLLP